MMLTGKNAAILGAVSGACFAAIFLSALPDFSFIDSLFIFIFGGFLVCSALFLVNAKSATSLLIKMMVRSSSGHKYAATAYFFEAAAFLLMCGAYVWAYSAAPSSMAFLLVIPSAAFAIRSGISLLRSFSTGSRL
jgi:hypothetical protein